MESDERLIARAREGDDEALADLVQRHAPRVLRFGLKLCGDEDDAREVLQNTLLTAARKIREFKGQSRFTTWLYAIARSFCIKQRTRGDAAVELEPLREALGVPAPQSDEPEHRVTTFELQGALERAIRSLETQQREVLVLRDVEGLSAPEVAQVIGVSLDAVKSRLHRARKALREQLSPLLEEAAAQAACPDVVDLLSRYQEGDINQEACRAMEAHVSRCPPCKARCDSLRRVLSACSSAPEPELPPALRSAVLQEMRRALAESALS
jgi:RNA polymerase sigma-70 factor, ECF subfamily